MILEVQSDTRRKRNIDRMKSGVLATELRAAAMAGDEDRVAALIAEVLRCQTPSEEEKLDLQLRTLADLFHTMRRMAMTDELTRLNNRRGFMRVGARLLNVAAHEFRKVRLVHVDVDNLKRVNDSAGHLAGDKLLRTTADVLRRSFPDNGAGEVIGRLGGDEFAALTVVRDQSDASALVQTIVAAVETIKASGVCAELSVSVGVAERYPNERLSMTDMLYRAERAMYAHKMTKIDRRRAAEPFSRVLAGLCDHAVAN